MNTAFVIRHWSLVIALALPLHAAPKKAPPAPLSPEAAEAAYTQAIEKRVADILAVLDLADPAKSANVHDVLTNQYRSLRAWHDANDPLLKTAPTNQLREINASLKALHSKFISALETRLTPGQIVQVKDKLTYGKVKVTYDAYVEIVPGLTDPEKKQILDFLVEAREEAMDAGSADEKSAIFKKYKGRINNYLDRQGHNVKQAYKDWGEKQKAKSAAKKESLE